MEKTQNWLDDLKIRFSYGTAGNNNIPADQTSPVWSSGSTTWLNQFPSYWTSGIASGQSGSYASNPGLENGKRPLPVTLVWIIPYSVAS